MKAVLFAVVNTVAADTEEKPFGAGNMPLFVLLFMAPMTVYNKWEARVI